MPSRAPWPPGRRGTGAAAGTACGGRGRNPGTPSGSRRSPSTATATRCCCRWIRPARPATPAAGPVSTGASCRRADMPRSGPRRPRMRYAVLSDVHGNLEALEAVLRDTRRGRLDACLCLGDTVGYGPDPNECAARIRALGGPVIAGNHDLAAAGVLDPSAFTPLARAAIEWTRDVLTQEPRAWLASLPARLDHPD